MRGWLFERVVEEWMVLYYRGFRSTVHAVEDVMGEVLVVVVASTVVVLSSIVEIC